MPNLGEMYVRKREKKMTNWSLQGPSFIIFCHETSGCQSSLCGISNVSNYIYVQTTIMFKSTGVQ